ncbi:hypothetical protein [Actinacidiphila yeochonensis]|uniref:hypothetical protein n=1 Tax=Actinacidiphila yeochonensis TaxID=89050 RepID=UPI000A3EC076|nr:hypothetical protein [Actinacidiphila yeochonensis]
MPLTRRPTAPTACRHCGLDRDGHFQRWTTAAGWHTWAMPDQALIKARMLARRTNRPV